MLLGRRTQGADRARTHPKRCLDCRVKFDPADLREVQIYLPGAGWPVFAPLCQTCANQRCLTGRW